MLPDWDVEAAIHLDLQDATLAHFRGRPLLLVLDEFSGRPYLLKDAATALGELARHPRAKEFGVVLFDTAFGGAWPAGGPASIAGSTFPIVGDRTPATTDRYGSRWAIAALDADGRLLHVGRTLDAALARILG